MNKRIHNRKGPGGRNRAGARIGRKKVFKAVQRGLREKKLTQNATEKAQMGDITKLGKAIEKKGFFRNLFSGRGR